MGTRAPQPPPHDKAPPPDGIVVPPKRTFVVAPACNHDPMHGSINLSVQPPYSDLPQPGPAYLRCVHCGELMGMIGVVGTTMGTR